MKSFASFITFSFFIVLFFVNANAQTATAEKSSADLTGVKITGAWRINYAESDNPLLKMQAVLQNKLQQNQNGKTAKEESLPTLSVSLVAPETLILAGDDEKSITINEGFSEIVFTRTLLTDGQKRSGELPDGSRFLLTAMQEKDLLKIETVSPRGNKMIETYAVSNEGKKLSVMVRFETPDAKEILSLRRVYDRTILDMFSGAAEVVQ